MKRDLETNADEELLSNVGQQLKVGELRGQSAAMKSLESLTPRQREILQLIAEGQSTKQMAVRLNISVKTVETHRAHLMDRLEIHNIPGLVRFAIRSGLIHWED